MPEQRMDSLVRRISAQSPREALAKPARPRRQSKSAESPVAERAGETSSQIRPLLPEQVLQLRHAYVARLAFILDAQCRSQARSLSGDPANRNEPGYVGDFKIGRYASSGRQDIFDLRGNEGAVRNLEFGSIRIGAGIADDIFKLSAAPDVLDCEFLDAVKESAEPHTELRGCFRQVDLFVSRLLTELLDVAPGPAAMLEFHSRQVRNVQGVPDWAFHIEPVHMGRRRRISGVTVEIVHPALGGAAFPRLACRGVLRVFRSSSHGHVDLIDVPDSADQTDVGFDFFKSRPCGRVNVAVSRSIDHDIGQDGLAPRLALKNGALHGSFGIHNRIDAPTIQVGSYPRIEQHISQHILERLRVDCRVNRRLVPIDDSELEYVQFLHQLFTDAEDN